ncbi:MAG: protogloblin ApPgb [Bdellovibrionaceae bacterium]|nr:protogloblin ApPgb [Pseudobdellovibrionaceae bacterium]
MKQLLLICTLFVNLVDIDSVYANEANAKIPGYDLHSKKLVTSPVSLKDLESLKKSLLFGEEDIKALRMSKAILADQTEAILDVWYGFVASTPELVYFFKNNKTGQPDADYLAAVRKRFAQWILDTADANYDQTWLNYQHEIGLRHAPAKKNKTDKANSVKLVNFRYIPALTIPITTTLKPFLAKKGAMPEDVEKMHQAWVKSVLLQSILWSQPYIKSGQF